MKDNTRHSDSGHALQSHAALCLLSVNSGDLTGAPPVVGAGGVLRGLAPEG